MLDLSRLLDSPPTPDERARLARHLAIALRLSLPALGLAALITGLAGSHLTSAGVLASLLPVLASRQLARRGRGEIASLVLVGSMLGLATWLLQRSRGFEDVAILLYPVIVLIAGLILPRGLYVAVVGLAVLSLASVAWSQQFARQGLWSDLLMAGLMLVVAAVMVHLLVEDMRRSMRLARSSEERYRLISEVTSDYTFSSVVDEAGRVRQDWVAGAFRRMTGWTFEEYLARGGWRAALHPDDVARDDRDLELLQAGEPVVSELRTFTRSGEVRHVRVYAHPVREGTRLRGIYGAVQDVTERRRAEAERESLIRELAAKNAELERFTYTASHDLKSPLVTVRGFLGFVERDALEGNHERLKADLRRIRDATDRMGQLLDELLELSRLGKAVGPPLPVDLGELAREAAAQVAGRIAERGVAVAIAEGLPTVQGDRTRLLQVLQNLLDNAVKFLGEQPRPRVEVGVRPGPEPVVFVRDNGIGIEERHRERVFGLFDKLDPESAGTGVGLALVRRIVELHGGRIWVESDGPGRGTAFCFTLPGVPS